MSFNLKTLQALICSPGIAGRRGLRPLFWGKPGVGKTALIESLASAMGAMLITIIASIREPADFLGLPMPDGKGGVIYAAPGWARAANAAAEKGQLVIVFIDEITTCAPAVQAALLRVVNEGWVGDIKLHNNVVFVAAANPPEIAAGGYDLSPPMANRWMHFEWNDPTAAEWSEGILSNWADTLSVEKAVDTIARIDARIDVTEAKAKGLTTGFLRANSQHLITLPDMSDPDASRAWPSLRTWELLIKSGPDHRGMRGARRGRGASAVPSRGRPAGPRRTSRREEPEQGLEAQPRTARHHCGRAELLRGPRDAEDGEGSEGARRRTLGAHRRRGEGRR
jgi:hypothetical protein